MEDIGRELRVLRLENGKSPFMDWFRSIRDKKAAAAIVRRFDRVEEGNLGDCKPVGGGVKELRIDVGPGYRIYFAEVGEVIIVLLGGGDKSTQQKDINRAIELWEANKNDVGRFDTRFEC